jgi:hypothetical protein
VTGDMELQYICSPNLTNSSAKRARSSVVISFSTSYKFCPRSRHRGGLARPVRCSNSPRCHKLGTLDSLSTAVRLDTKSMSGVDLLQGETSVLYRFSRPHTILGTTVKQNCFYFWNVSELFCRLALFQLLSWLHHNYTYRLAYRFF